jgi:hypothetical protein
MNFGLRTMWRQKADGLELMKNKQAAVLGESLCWITQISYVPGRETMNRRPTRHPGSNSYNSLLYRRANEAGARSRRKVEEVYPESGGKPR